MSNKVVDCSYQRERFLKARRSLMMPHSESEATSIFWAIQSCRLGLGLDTKQPFDRSSLSDDAQNRLMKLDSYLDKKPEDFSEDDKLEFSDTVDALATHFCIKAHDA